MNSSLPYYRPGLRTATYAAFTQMSLSEQAIREGSQLNVCRDTLEETLLILHPKCQLAFKLQDALDEVRRRSLSMLRKDDTRQHYSDLGPQTSSCPSQPDNIWCDSAQARVGSVSDIEIDSNKNDSNAVTTSVFRAVPSRYRQFTSKHDVQKSSHAGKKHRVDIDAEGLPVTKRLKVGGHKLID
ncbi:hypothetical protein FOFC_13722 [Fusarium oxysporum]|nr:hypothetical protein FOFC_13722 [Fusarium oxysporum]